MATRSESETSPPHWLPAFWRILKRIDQSKRNSARMALRNSLAVALPLAVSIELDHPLVGVAMATGALNVAFSDASDPYAHRARRMLTWSVLGAIAVFLGSVTGNYHLLAILVASAWALIAGLMVSISTRAGDLGLNTLVALIVYAARGALSPKGAFYAGLLVLGGGLLQTAFALIFWPVRRNTPERRAIGGVYLDLAEQVEQDSADVLSAPLKQPSPEVQDTLSALGRDHSLEGERFRLLYDQAERLYLSIYAVRRIRAELAPAVLTLRDDILRLSCEILRAAAQSLLNDDPAAIQPHLRLQLDELAEQAQAQAAVSPASTGSFASAVDVLAGQLRIVLQLASSSTTFGAEEFAVREFAPPLKLQMRSWLATLRANLDIHSPAFRHALRLAICVAAGDAIGRSINTQRNYWLPMTVAVVLKPDFTTTISRGILRLCGTFAGLVLATVCYHLLPATALAQLFLVGVFTFLLRYVGPANYGIFTVAISGLIVFLIATTGVSPADVIGQRAINTAAGGVFALLAYALWPTWERSHVSYVLADMIDRSRDYFRAVAERCYGASEALESELDATRNAWRHARSRAEASVDRVGSEPGLDPARLDVLMSILASSHAFARTIMGLEAALLQSPSDRPLPAFEKFAHDVEFTLYFLAAALRGSSIAAETLPQLREDHRRLLDAYKQAGMHNDSLLIETDRLTISLNTLREQVIRYLSTKPEASDVAHTTMK